MLAFSLKPACTPAIIMQDPDNEPVCAWPEPDQLLSGQPAQMFLNRMLFRCGIMVPES